MKKHVKALLLILTMLIVTTIGCGYVNAETVETKNSKAFLELHFSNGEIYRTKIKYIYYPNCYSNDYGGKNNYINESFTDEYYYDPSKLVPSELQNSGAVLDNGWAYSFSDVITLTFDEETKTVAIYLWRDTPYELEKQVFEKVEE